MTETRRRASTPSHPPERRWGDESSRGARKSRQNGADVVWRATVDQRLTGVEDAIGDLRTRVNSVLALIGAAVIGQVALRFFGH